jgi:hypothetical protein
MNESYSAGRALSLGFSVFFRNIIPFTIIALLISVPEIIYTYMKLDGIEFGMFGELSDPYLAWKLTALSVLTGLVMQSALTYGTVMQLKGQPASMGGCISTGLKRFFPVLGTGILLGIILVVILFGMALIMVALQLGIVGLIGMGVVLCLVYTIYYVAIPAAVLERPGVSGALLRSRELTTGRRGGVFGTILLIFVARWLTSYIVNDALVNPEALMSGEESLEHLLKKIMWVDLGITLFYSMLAGTIAAVTYYLLRSEKEGTSADDLASVFD